MTDVAAVVPDAEQIDRFARTVCDEADRAAAAAGGWVSTTVMVAGQPVALRTSGPGATGLLPGVTHRAAPSPPAGRAPIRLDALDTSATGLRLPATTWRWDDFTYRSGGLLLEFESERRILTLTDHDRRHVLTWTQSGRTGAWEFAAPWRPLLDRLLAPLGHTMVHAASIGRAGRTVLLAGPGGSGKSTAVHAALDQGFETVGDDFLLLPAGTTGIVESLYRTTRLRPTSPRFDPRVHRVVDDGFGNDKALAFVDETHPGQLVLRQDVAAIVAPVITGRARSVLVPVSPIEILRALVPSSILLADRRPEALPRLVALTRAVPGYRLESGTDLDDLVGTVASLLEGD